MENLKIPSAEYSKNGISPISRLEKKDSVLSIIRKMNNNFKLILGLLAISTALPDASLADTFRNSKPTEMYALETSDINKLLDEIEAAIDREDWEKAAELFDRIFDSGSEFRQAWIYKQAAAAYGLSGQYKKNEKMCDRGLRESEKDDADEKKYYLDLLESCSRGLSLGKTNPQKGLQYLLIKYSMQTGLTDKQAILEKIALNKDDVLLSIAALENAGKYEEAANLLTFYFQINPALMNNPESNPFFNIAMNLYHQHHAKSALVYYYDRKREERWAQKWERTLQEAIPIVILGKMIYDDAAARKQEEEKKAVEERQRAEDDKMRRQIQHDNENVRRRRYGLPTIEEEESRQMEQRERERDRIRQRCLENCETERSSCLTLSDPNCYREGAPLDCITPSRCEGIRASCRSKCN